MTDHKPCTFATAAPQLFSVLGRLRAMIFLGGLICGFGGLAPSPALSTPLVRICQKCFGNLCRARSYLTKFTSKMKNFIVDVNKLQLCLIKISEKIPAYSESSTAVDSRRCQPYSDNCTVAVRQT